MNKHLLHDLTEMGLWSPAVKNRIIYEDGSVQKIPEIPEDLKVIYKYVFTIWSCNMLLFLIFPMLIHFFFFSGLFGRSSNGYWLIWPLIVDAT